MATPAPTLATPGADGAGVPTAMPVGDQWTRVEGTVIATLEAKHEENGARAPRANGAAPIEAPPVKMDVDSETNLRNNESIQEKAITDMVRKVVRESEVAGPTSGPSASRFTRGTQAPIRAPSLSSSRRSRSASSDSSDSSSESCSEAQRRRAGPHPRHRQAPKGPPGLTPMVEVHSMATPRPPTTTRCRLDFAQVVDHPLFDLEHVEHMLREDKTNTIEMLMNTDSSRSLSDMKRRVMQIIPRRLRIYQDGTSFVLRPPRKRPSKAEQKNASRLQRRPQRRPPR